MAMQYKIMLVICCFFVITISFAIPVYGEVKSLKADKTLYANGDTIIFSGTVDKEDFRKMVNIVIHDPQNNFVGITAGFSEEDNTFHIPVKTTDAQFQNKFALKGTYNATAFITVESKGITLGFDFSPDGSPVVHSQTTTPVPPPKTETTEEPKPKQDVTSQTQPDTTQQTSDGGKSVQEKIQERIEIAKKQREALSKPPVQTAPTENHIVNQTSSVNVVNNTVTKPVTHTEEKSAGTDMNTGQFDLDSSSFIYAIAGIVGAAAVAAIIYGVKNKKKNKKQAEPKDEQAQKTEAQEKTILPPEDQYPLMILKNRLAKGEITIEEFNELKDALKEP